mmetsp:Transcript_33375/g.50487  ORF Transcript_33375/g.50487 Transcript_33375/m.50487 type:complete len:99 (+) Transcript_33375:28-324(+)
MCRKPNGWCHRMRQKKINIWDCRRMRVDKWLCKHPYDEVKFFRPPWLTRYGNPANPRSDPKSITPDGQSKFCNMSRLHQQDAKNPYDRYNSKQLMEPE